MILDLARQGLSVSAIARRTGNDRKTIRKYIDRGLEPPAYKPREPGPSLIRPFEAFLRERVTRFPDLTGQRLWREIRELGDGWTIVTKDRSLSAQWEHTVLVTPEGFEVLTLSAGSPPSPA